MPNASLVSPPSRWTWAKPASVSVKRSLAPVPESSGSATSAPMLACAPANG